MQWLLSGVCTAVVAVVVGPSILEKPIPAPPVEAPAPRIDVAPIVDGVEETVAEVELELTRGMTRDEVEAALGAPVIKSSDDVWVFETARVLFDGDAVKGWIETEHEYGLITRDAPVFTPVREAEHRPELRQRAAQSIGSAARAAHRIARVDSERRTRRSYRSNRDTPFRASRARLISARLYGLERGRTFATNDRDRRDTQLDRSPGAVATRYRGTRTQSRLQETLRDKNRPLRPGELRVR